MSVYAIRDRLISVDELFISIFLRVRHDSTRVLLEGEFAGGLLSVIPFIRHDSFYEHRASTDQRVDKGALQGECREVFNQKPIQPRRPQ